GGGEIAKNDVTALLAAQVQILFHHFLDDVAIADFCAQDLSASGSERFVQTEIAHDGGDERVLLEAAAAQKIDRSNGHNFIAIDNFAVLITYQAAVSVALV